MVGANALISPLSYVAIGRETVLGTYNTCTANLEFQSSSLKTTQENKVLEEITRNRVMREKIKMGKVVEGELSFYFRPESDACNYILQQGMGGAITTATATGETVGGSAFTHTYEIGDMDNSYTSLCINTRKGQVTDGKIFQYSGMRVNEWGISAEIDESLVMNASLIGFDSTVTTNDVESALTTTCLESLSFVSGRVSIENSFSSLTSTSFWEVQSVNFTMTNNLKADNESRRIGSDILEVLPVGMANLELTLGIRFDTTTAHDAMLNGTQLACELVFQGSTLTGSNLRKELKLQFPKLFVNDSGDPEIGGPDEILVSEVTFNVLHDCSSAGGYAIKAYVTNNTSSYQ